MKPDNITQTDWELLVKKYPNNLEEVKKQLANHYPVQYLIGNVPFLNTLINVDERVLIPRFETEFLVEKTIQKIKELNLENPSILELGTGSGCISIALKKNLNCQITAVDNQQSCLDLAYENSLENKTDITFIKSDMLDISYEGYLVIISNPPYVAFDEAVGEETKFEPQNALFAANDGLYYYENILKKVSHLTKLPKLIAFEIGYLQGPPIKKFQKIYLPSFKTIIEVDLTGRCRYVFLINE